MMLREACQSDSDFLLRERTIHCYLPFARILAAKAYAKRTSYDLEFLDYLQYACVGLVEAVDRFDPARNVKFETFAAHRITGAMLNGIYSFSEKQAQIHARGRIMSDRMTSCAGVVPDARDPRAVFSCLAEISMGLAISFALENSGMYQSEEAAYPDNASACLELKQIQQQLTTVLDLLTENERRVLSYHYYQQLAFEEIASMVGLTKGRISQIHKSAMERLRAHFCSTKRELICC